MVYGKVLDWYDDSTIRWATLICVVSTALFIYLEKTRQSPYFLLEAFKHRSIHPDSLVLNFNFQPFILNFRSEMMT